MRKILAVLAFTAVGFGCSSSYNEAGVEKLLNQKGIRVWTDTFVNNSNLMTIEKPIGVVVSSKSLPDYQVRAIKAYMKDQYEIENVKYYYRPNAYDQEYISEGASQ